MNAPRRSLALAVTTAALALAPRDAWACVADAECAPASWCRPEPDAGDDAGTGTCAPKAPNGQLVPGGTCDGELAARACASGVCDYVSSLCGRPIGDDCVRDAECTGGVCVQDAGDAGAADADDAGPPAPGVCRECRTSADCADKGALRVCDPSDGRCAACVADVDCGGETPFCDRAVRACVAPRSEPAPGEAGAGGGAGGGGGGSSDGGSAATPEGLVEASGGCAAAPASAAGSLAPLGVFLGAALARRTRGRRRRDG